MNKDTKLKFVSKNTFEGRNTISWDKKGSLVRPSYNDRIKIEKGPHLNVGGICC